MKTAHRHNASSRFSFTAKAPREGNRTPMNKIKYSEERDQETGYGYFGARYYDPDISALWLPVDPMADKHPGIIQYTLSQKQIYGIIQMTELILLQLAQIYICELMA